MNSIRFYERQQAEQSQSTNSGASFSECNSVTLQLLVCFPNPIIVLESISPLVSALSKLLCCLSHHKDKCYEHIY